MSVKTQDHEALMISIGGGKGGVGKSMVSANLAVQYAQAGMKVILIDLDFGAANVHTIFGIRRPPKGLGEYFLTPGAKLKDFVIPTNVPNLSIIPGSGFVPELANLQHSRKVKLIRQIKTLDADLVLLDLGAGSAHNVVDFFSLTHASVVVTTPEPTAIVNAYEFLKNVIYRILFRIFKNSSEITQILKASTQPNNPLGIHTVADLITHVEKQYPMIADSIRDICDDLDFYVIFNQARKSTQAQLGRKLRDISQRYLHLDLNYLGMVYHNEEVSTAVFKMCPLSVHNPDSVTSKTIRKIAIQLFHQVSSKMLTGEHAESFEDQVQRVMLNAREDFTENLLTQKRLFRAKIDDPTLEKSPLAEVENQER